MIQPVKVSDTWRWMRDSREKPLTDPLPGKFDSDGKRTLGRFVNRRFQAVKKAKR